MKVSKWTKSGTVILSLVLIVLLAVTALANVFVMNASALKYSSDYGTRERLREESLSTNQKLMEEGMTLLKNEGGTLPLSKEVPPRITVFGKNSVNPVYSGSGSSGGVNQPQVSPYASLRNAGFIVNPDMETFYSSKSLSGTGRVASGMNSYNMGGAAIGETRATGSVVYADGESAASDGALWNETVCPQKDLNYDPSNTTAGYSNYESVRSSYSQYSDAAVVVLSRIGGEGFDLPRTMRMAKANSAGSDYPAGETPGAGRFSVEGTYTDSVIVPGARSMDDHYLQLDQNEVNMLREAAYYFDNIIVVINSATQMELGFLDDPGHYAYQKNIKAALWMATPGENGFAALGPILRGKVNPSGGLVSTWFRDFKADPTWKNIGNNSNWNGNAYQYLADETKPYNATTNPYLNSGLRFTDYQEGIYMGARYYETRGYYEGSSDYVTNGTTVPHINGTTTTEWDNWYDAHVVYPIGHGLSYTSFDYDVESYSMDGVEFDSEDTLDPTSKSTFTVKVKVTNTGFVSGKNTVELYATAPYTGGVEKAHKVLVGFAKTPLLAPGQSAVLSIEAEAYHLASFDYKGLNANGFKGYVLEAGDYVLTVAQNAHDATEEIKFTLDEILEISEDPFTDGEIDIAFEDMSVYMNDNSEILSRKNGFENIADLTDGGTRRLKTQEWLKSFGVLWNKPNSGLTNASTNADEWNRFWNEASVLEQNTFQSTGNNPVTYTINKEHRYAEIFELSGAPVVTVAAKPYNIIHPTKEKTYDEIYNDPDGLQFWDMTGLDYNDLKWEKMMSQLTWVQISQLIGRGMYHNIGIDTIGKPSIMDLDGPVGWTGGGTSGWAGQSNSTGRGNIQTNGPTEYPIKLVSGCIVAATYNTELANHMGRIVGEEGMWGFDGTNHDAVGGWYAPGANLHRSPFSGRNFEYYSENEYLTGRMAGAMMTGAQDKGVYSYLKHYFLNDTETDRNTNGLTTWADEQAMREMYARAFEIAIKEANKHNSKLVGIMTGYNRIGKIWVGGSYSANTQLLRNEWGFEGISITDNTYDYRSWMNQEQAILSGSDIRLSGNQDEITYNPSAARSGFTAGSGSGNRTGIPAVNSEVLNMTSTVTLPFSKTTISGANFSNTYKWALYNAAKHILYVTCNSNAVNRINRVVANYVNLSTAAQNADGKARSFAIGSVVNYNLYNDVAGYYKPFVLSGDRSKVSYSYSLHDTSPALPAGLSLSSNGTISGIMQARSGSSATVVLRVSISATSSDGKTTYLPGYQQVTFPQGAAPSSYEALSLTGGLLGAVEAGEAASNIKVTANRSQDAAVSISYKLKEGAVLPEGLTLGSDGKITGTVPAGTPFYTAKFTVIAEAKLASGNTVYETAEAEYSLVVGAIDTALIQTIVDAAIQGKISEAEAQKLIEDAVAGKVTAEEVQELIDGSNGCNGTIATDGIVIYIVLVCVALTAAALIFLRKRKN